MTTIAIISSGMGEPSTSHMLADRYAQAIEQAMPDASVERITLRELARDITDAAMAGFASPRLQHVIDQVTSADALVVVSPIYNGSYAGLFKLFVDVFEENAFTGKPVLLAATGGTARHSLAIEHAMRPLFAYLQALALPTGVFASPHDWSSEGVGALTERVTRAVDELASILSGSGTGRGPADEFDLTSPTFLAASRPKGT